MDLPGGENIMLGQWRVVLRQAEEAARAGRLDDALALAGREDVAEFRQAIQLRNRLNTELLDRATRRAQAHDVAGAIQDLALAQGTGAQPDALAAARLHVADLVAQELRLDLEAGEPGRVVERIEALERQQISGPALKRVRETARAWFSAIQEWGRGEFSQARSALERSQRLSEGVAETAIQAALKELEWRQCASAPRIEAMYAAIQAKDWTSVLTQADAVIELVPEHPAARQARARAWQEIGGYSGRGALPRRQGYLAPSPRGGVSLGEPIMEELGRREGGRLVVGEPGAGLGGRPALSGRLDPGPGGRFLLWADAIGGFLVCLEDEVVLGRAAADSLADVALLGDLSRRHASIIRSGEGYLIRAHHDTYINGRSVQEAAIHDGDVIRLGSSVEIEFRQPSPVSLTARLELLSHHRLQMAVDAVILMADTCIMGPTVQAHVPAPRLESPVVLYRKGSELWVRGPGEFEVDEKPYSGRAPLGSRSSVLGEWFSFSLEPLSASGRV